MKIALACDHGGFELKEKLKDYLKELRHEVDDKGCLTDEKGCDYPDYGIPAVASVVAKENDRAILICTNGIGMSMLANKFPGIVAALIYSKRTAEMTRKHHDSNVLCLGGKEFDHDDLLEWVKIWLTTEFAGNKPEGERHLRRILKVQGVHELWKKVKR